MGKKSFVVMLLIIIVLSVLLIFKYTEKNKCEVKKETPNESIKEPTYENKNTGELTLNSFAKYQRKGLFIETEIVNGTDQEVTLGTIKIHVLDEKGNELFSFNQEVNSHIYANSSIVVSKEYEYKKINTFKLTFKYDIKEVN